MLSDRNKQLESRESSVESASRERAQARVLYRQRRHARAILNLGTGATRLVRSLKGTRYAHPEPVSIMRKRSTVKAVIYGITRGARKRHDISCLCLSKSEITFIQKWCERDSTQNSNQKLSLLTALPTRLLDNLISSIMT